VVATPSLNGKTLFLATAHDEFEMLDFNADWVHYGFPACHGDGSGAPAWRCRRNSDIPPSSASAAPVAADLFQVTRERLRPFPGDWEPRRGGT